MLLKNCAYIITQNKSREILKGYDILLEGNTLKKIAKNIPSSINTQSIDCSQKIVLPGLINAHTHIGMQSLRGICDDEELPLWLEKVIAAEKKLTLEQIKENAVMACREMIAAGTTCFIDMYYPMKPVFEGVIAAGIRAQLQTSIYGGLGNEEEQFRAMEALVKENKQQDSSLSSLITMGIGPHSIYYCSEAMLKRIKKYADQHHLLISIHIAETRKERFDIHKKTAFLPVQYLEHLGFLGKNVALIHAVWLTKGEVQIIAKHDASVVHCPVSNMKLSSGGVIPLMEMFDADVCVGLGTDSAASNNNLDLFKEMRIAGLLHKHHRWDPKVARAQELLDMATIAGAKILGKEKELGSLEEGKLADVVALSITEKCWPLQKENVLSHLIYSCEGADVADVFIDGKKVK